MGEAEVEGESCLELCSMLLIKSRLALRVQSIHGDSRETIGERNINKLLPGFVMETLTKTAMEMEAKAEQVFAEPRQLWQLWQRSQRHFT